MYNLIPNQRLLWKALLRLWSNFSFQMVIFNFFPSILSKKYVKARLSMPFFLLFPIKEPCRPKSLWLWKKGTRICQTTRTIIANFNIVKKDVINQFFLPQIYKENIYLLATILFFEEDLKSQLTSWAKKLALDEIHGFQIIPKEKEWHNLAPRQNKAL